MAFFFIPLVSITLSGLPPQRMAAASGVSNFMRITAGAFGTSIATTLWEDRAKLHHVHLVEVASSGRAPTAEALNGLTNLGLAPSQAWGMINRVVDEQAFTLAATDIFYASALMFLALIPMVWITRPKRPGMVSK